MPANYIATNNLEGFCDYSACPKEGCTSFKIHEFIPWAMVIHLPAS